MSESLAGTSASAFTMGAADPRAVEAAVERLRAAYSPLPDKPEETPEAAVAALWHRAAGSAWSADRARQVPLPSLDAAGSARFESLLERRIAGEPLAYLTGRQQFLGLELLADPAALIPRRETELLARQAIAMLHALPEEPEGPLVIDVCTGGGNVALAIAAHVPRARVLCADLSPEAAALARRNAELCGFGARVDVRVGDLLQPFDGGEFAGRVAIVTCNPPYIPTRSLERLPGEIAGHEPRLAFDGGPLGLSIVHRLVQDAPRYLRPGGAVMFEVGRGQGALLLGRIGRGGRFVEVAGVPDTANEVRVIVARVGHPAAPVT